MFVLCAINVDETVGFDVGFLIAELEWIYEGIFVGEMVGFNVGLLIGELEGIYDGIFVGVLVGIFVLVIVVSVLITCVTLIDKIVICCAWYAVAKYMSIGMFLYLLLDLNMKIIIHFQMECYVK